MHERNPAMWEENENEKADMQCLAESIPRSVRRPTLEELFETEGRSLDLFESGDVHFLKALYAARIMNYDPRYEETDEYPNISLADISEQYESEDPKIFERLQEEIAFVVEKTTLDE